MDKIKLQEKINELESKQTNLKYQISELRDEYNKKYLLKEREERFLNKCFVYLNNRYSCSDECWNVYFCVLAVEKDHVLCLVLEKDSDGIVKCGKVKKDDSEFNCLAETSKKEFMDNFNENVMMLNSYYGDLLLGENND